MNQFFTQPLVITSFLTVVILCVHQVSLAQVRSSTNYQLQSDSINIGGGLSNSTNYTQESTVGEAGTGRSSSTNYQLRAGYQQMQEVYISLSDPGDVTLEPDLPGITGGTANGSTTVTVITDSPSGYSLTIGAENSPAMRSGANSIADHITITTYNFLVPAASARFGYSVFGNDTVAEFRHDGSLCSGSGPTNTQEQCWRGLTTSGFSIAEGTGSNHPSGATTTVYFRIGITANAGVATGLYTATTTLTALPL
jgi:hypothetical protein